MNTAIHPMRSRNAVSNVLSKAAPRMAAGMTEMTSSQAIRRFGSSPIRRSRIEPSHERAHVEHHVERGRVGERVVPAEELRDEDEMRRGGDRQELGKALDQP